VDDEPDFVACLKTIFEADGFTVTTASDGQEALSRVQETPPDLVTLDIQMPRKTGLLFFRQMKSDAKLRSIPVIVITGLRRLNDYAGPFIERFFEVEERKIVPEAYVDKPVDMRWLLAMVREFLRGPQPLPGGASA
jgi:CheY-like chemotaxis protein